MFFTQKVTNQPQPNASSTTTLPHELDITTDEFIIFWKLLEFSPVTGNASSTPLDITVFQFMCDFSHTSGCR